MILTFDQTVRSARRESEASTLAGDTYAVREGPLLDGYYQALSDGVAVPRHGKKAADGKSGEGQWP